MCLLSSGDTESKFLGLLELLVVLFYMTIFLCVFYLAEERKAGCLVYWYMLLCYFI